MTRLGMANRRAGSRQSRAHQRETCFPLLAVWRDSCWSAKFNDSTYKSGLMQSSPVGSDSGTPFLIVEGEFSVNFS